LFAQAGHTGTAHYTSMLCFNPLKRYSGQKKKLAKSAPVV